MLPDSAVFQKRLDALPIATYKAGETVLYAGSRTGLLLILKTGRVAVVKDDIKIAEVAEPGAVFGELSTLLDQPHAADVYALEASQFHVTGAEALLKEDPVAHPARCYGPCAAARQCQSGRLRIEEPASSRPAAQRDRTDDQEDRNATEPWHWPSGWPVTRLRSPWPSTVALISRTAPAAVKSGHVPRSRHRFSSPGGSGLNGSGLLCFTGCGNDLAGSAFFPIGEPRQRGRG
jgi:hypothetical protein